MQQHLMQMQPMMAAYGPNNVTTDIIQQLDACVALYGSGFVVLYLDENKQLILAILDNQSSGKINECAENQAKLQRNLMYLAAIADSQPQMPPMAQFPFIQSVQFPGNTAMQSGAARYMQHQQAQQVASAAQPMMVGRSPLLYAQPTLSTLQQQQAMHASGQLGMSSGGNNSGGGLQMMHGSNTSIGGGNGSLSAGGFPGFGRGGGDGLQGSGKQDGSTEGRGGGGRGRGRADVLEGY
ncbi:GRF1-interacting factor 1 [Acorus calamus]|uniref:GRF1-interacting factor 1 n=1 Tax=Acorus calamus TaxID=4465 RepID=A0AAV9CH14_ACOCL|nr:GRF1-interacting factor 1 [Acorus calamus]